MDTGLGLFLMLVFSYLYVPILAYYAFLKIDQGGPGWVRQPEDEPPGGEEN